MSEDRTKLLTQLAAELHHQADQDSTVTAALDHVLEVVPDAEAVSVTMRSRHPRAWETVACTGDLAATADAEQYELNEGPCVETALAQEWHRAGDIAHDTRWPRWGPRAAKLGVASLLSVPMQFEGTPAGAINMYSTRPGAFESREVVEFAALYASHVAMAIADARKTEGLHTAMSSRHRIGVAQGILMKTYDLSLEQSFALLRRYSNNTNTKINDLATQIIEDRHLPGVDEVTIEAVDADTAEV